MYINVDDTEKEISFHYPIDNRNGNKKVGLIRAYFLSVSIMLTMMKRSTLKMVKH